MTAKQKDSFWSAKGLVLKCKRTPFREQKDSFWSAKGLLFLALNWYGMRFWKSYHIIKLSPPLSKYRELLPDKWKQKKYRSRIKTWAIFFWCVYTNIADTLSHKDACHPLLNSNFLHATIAILHDIQSLGWSRQSLTIYWIASYLLNIGRGCNLVDACCVEFYYVLNVVAKVRGTVIITSSLWYIKCAFLGINSYEYITTFWYFLCIYINRS